MEPKTNTWSEAEYNLLEKLITLVNARREHGYPDEECGVTVNGDGSAIEISAEDFAYELAKELTTIQDGGPSMLDYAINEANQNLEGMMGGDT